MADVEHRERLRRHLETTLNLTVHDRAIRAIRVNSAQHWQPPLYIEVGGSCANLERDAPAETILAIFEGSVFVVVTPQHDGTTKPPYLFAKEDVRQVIEFE